MKPRGTSFVLLLSASGAAAFTAPAFAKRSLTVTSAKSGSYPTINGWTADPDAFAYGLPGALDPVGEFDPAGFLTNDDGSVKTLSETKMLREAEVTHGRVSMLAALGFLVQEQWHPLFEAGNKDLGPAIFHLDEVRSVAPAFFEILALSIGLCEVARSVAGWVSPAKGSVGLNQLPGNSARALEIGYYPGDIGFDPLGLKPEDPAEFAEMATKELQNGRVAMIAVAGFFAQELVNGLSISDNLAK